MSWIKFSTLTLLLVGSTATLAETLVVRSSGPSSRSFPPGKLLPDTGRIVLKANDQLVILDDKGTRTLKGPGSFVPARPTKVAEKSGTATRLAALAGQKDERRARIGAVRGTPPAESSNGPVNLWFADTSRGGAVCVADPGAVTLWRPDANAPALATLATDADRSWALSWAAGQATMAWPADAPVSNDARYRISFDGSDKAVEFRFAALDPMPDGVASMARALIANDCQPQLDLLIATTGTGE